MYLRKAGGILWLSLTVYWACLVVLVRADGGIRFVESYYEGIGLEGASSVAVSPDGQHLYVAGWRDDAVVVFNWDELSETLNLVEVQRDGVGGVEGLREARSVTVSPDGRHVYVTGWSDTLVAFSRDEVTGGLRFVEVQRDGVAGVDGLEFANSVTVSPDGHHVYVAGASDGAIAVFAREETTGALNYLEVQRNGVAGVAGLSGVNSVTVSPDGQHIYAASWGDDAVVVFKRDEITGALRFVEVQQDGVNGVDGLQLAHAVTVSPDGQHVYAVSSFFFYEGGDNTLVVFRRDQITGKLSFVTLYQDEDETIDGLFGANSVTVSPDGRYVYVAASTYLVGGDDSVAVFRRDVATGMLSFVSVQKDGVGGVDDLRGAQSLAASPNGKYIYVASDTDDAVSTFSQNDPSDTLSLVDVRQNDAAGINGLGRVTSATVSPDGKHLYAAGYNDRAVAVFSRDETTGVLDFVEVEQNGGDGIDGLYGAASIKVSPDGQHIYVAGEESNAVVVFSRDEVTGGLSLVEVHQDGINNVDGLEGAASITVSPDGHHVYVAGRSDDAIAVFSRDESTGALEFVGVHRDGVADIDGLGWVVSVTVSPDGQYVYAASVSDRAVTVFRRDPALGLLDFVAMYQDEAGDVEGLLGPSSVVVSPDGRHVYVATGFFDGGGDNALVVFNRDEMTGMLSLVEIQWDGVDGVDGLEGASSVAVSPDGQHVYVAGRNDNAVAIFSRDQMSGRLHFVGDQRNKFGGVHGLAGAKSVTVSPDSQHIYVAGQWDDALALFSASPVLTVDKSVSDIFPKSGQPITYTLVAANRGIRPATNVVVSDTLSNELMVAGPITLDPPGSGSLLLPGIGTSLPSTVRVSNLTINPSMRVTVTIPVTVSPELVGVTMITNTVVVTSSETSTPLTGIVRITVAEEQLYLPLIMKFQ